MSEHILHDDEHNHEDPTVLDAGWSVDTEQLKARAAHVPPALVEGLLPSAAVITFAGSPGLGKSFTALSWAASIANGTPWFGRAVHAGPVVYVLGEGAARFGDRAAGWESVHGPISPRLRYVDGGAKGVDLADEGRVGLLIEQLRVWSPVLLVLDTFSMLAQVKSENDNAEVARVYRQAHRIVAEVGCSVLIVHHVAKGSTVVRGATAFRGNADTVVIAKPADGGADGFELTTDGEHDGKQRDFSPVTLGGFKVMDPGVLARDEAAARRAEVTSVSQAEALPPMLAAAMAAGTVPQTMPAWASDMMSTSTEQSTQDTNKAEEAEQ